LGHALEGEVEPFPAGQLPSSGQRKGLLVLAEQLVAGFFGEVGFFLAGDEIAGEGLQFLGAVGVELDQ